MICKLFLFIRLTATSTGTNLDQNTTDMEIALQSWRVMTCNIYRTQLDVILSIAPYFKSSPLYVSVIWVSVGSDKVLSTIRPMLCYCQLDPQWNSNQNLKRLFIRENTHENIVCETANILSRGEWVKCKALLQDHRWPPCQNIHKFSTTLC